MPNLSASAFAITLPVEVWREIIVLATAVDWEFDPLAWQEENNPWLLNQNRSTSSIDSPYIDNTHHQLSISIPIRAAIRMVSKTWQKIVDEIFFSSLHLRSRQDMVLAAQTLEKSFEAKGDRAVGRWVKRITFGPPSDADLDYEGDLDLEDMDLEDMEDLEETIGQILKRCPNLLLVVDKGTPPGLFLFPTFDPLRECQKLQHIFSNTSHHFQCSWSPTSFFASMHSLRTLEIFRIREADEPFELSFPYLHTLQLVSSQAFALSAVATWKLPSLRRLIVEYSILEYSQGLHTFTSCLTDLILLGRSDRPARDVLQGLHLPNLRRLCLNMRGERFETVISTVFSCPTLDTAVLNFTDSARSPQPYVDITFTTHAALVLKRLVFVMDDVATCMEEPLAKIAEELKPKVGR